MHTKDLPLVFLVHLRTDKPLKKWKIQDLILYLVEPNGYLVKHAKAVITDSVGIVQETTVMGISGMIFCDNRESPATISIGTNKLIGTNRENRVPHLSCYFQETSIRLPRGWK
jgi:UDP-N-acetylglucosamine 2-epimerase (non-hydrolysing)